MHQVRYALTCLVMGMSVASQAQVTLTPTKTIQLSKVVINPDIPKANQHVRLGLICLMLGDPVNFGPGERTVNYEHFDRLFSATLIKRGFKVVAKSSNLFDGEGDAPHPDILIGATFRPLSVNICDTGVSQKGTIAISVEWQIYDRSKQQVVETATTQGSAPVPKFEASGVGIMIDQSFSAALSALIDQGVLQKYVGMPKS